MSIGIMQGRLSSPGHNVIQSFPAASWEQELAIAAELRFEHIEWLFDRFTGFENPIFTVEGRNRMRRTIKSSGVGVLSLCADYFRDFPLKTFADLHQSGRKGEFERLLLACGEAGIKRIMIPYVDNSKINSAGEIHETAGVLRELLEMPTAKTMTISLETNLCPDDYARLLQAVDHPNLKVNYDIGDSASLGYDPAEEIAVFGKWICNVHIKDRIRDGGSVPLGKGNADIPRSLNLLRENDYNEGFVLQGARGNDDVETARLYREQTEVWLKAAGFE